MIKFIGIKYLLAYFAVSLIILWRANNLFSIIGLQSLYIIFVLGLLSRILVTFDVQQPLRKYLWGSLVGHALFLVFIVVVIYQQNFESLANFLILCSAVVHSLFIYLLLLECQQKNNQNKASEASLVQALKKAEIGFEQELKNQQDTMENKVQERTLELHVALQELEESNRELAKKTTIDELTSLYNRRFYDNKILAEFRRSRRNLTPLSLVVVDIDYFKKVNDNYGHLAGDHCLQMVASTLKNFLQRSSDIVCRYGGEEFCLILPETPEQGATNLAEELRQIIEKLVIVYHENTIALTISCGIATYQQQKSITPETLFSAADKALYQAKEAGRNQVKLAELPLIQKS